MVRTIELPERTVAIEAAPGLVFQVVAAGGTTVEERGPTEKVVEFQVRAGRSTVVTRELVRLHPPNRIDYTWIDGPLPSVTESIHLEAAPGGGTLVRYRGRFQPPRGPPSRIVGRLVIRRQFDRAVRQHLADAKRTAEQRQARSMMFRNSEEGVT